MLLCIQISFKQFKCCLTFVILNLISFILLISRRYNLLEWLYRVLCCSRMRYVGSYMDLESDREKSKKTIQDLESDRERSKKAIQIHPGADVCSLQGVRSHPPENERKRQQLPHMHPYVKNPCTHKTNTSSTNLLQLRSKKHPFSVHIRIKYKYKYSY